MINLCTIDGCGKPVVGRGWCRTHYMRWQRHGTPEPGNTRRATKDELIAKLHANIRVEGDCWLWTAAKMKSGYGVTANAGVILAHRLSYELHVGPIPEGLALDHLCRNKACINPAHLEPVTGRENVQRHFRQFPRKSECKRGHVLTADNVIIERGIRRCRTCREQYLANREASRVHGA